MKKPWENPYKIEIMVRGKKDLPLHLNGSPAIIEEHDGIQIIRCKVVPDGGVSPHSN